MHTTRDLTRNWRRGDGLKLATLETEAQTAWPGGGGWQITPENSERDIRESDLLGAFVTEEGDRMVSICTIRAKPGQRGQAYVPYLNCHPDYHGQKHGKAVLWAAVARGFELGFRMIDISTWAANLKAVPLYKKMGFMWQPNTSVRLENFTPTARRHPLGRPYFRDNDWYGTLLRPVDLVEDLLYRGNVRVYEYVWKSDSGQTLRMVFDRQSWEPVEIETEDLLVSATVPEERLIAGVPYSIRWRVVNKRSAPVQVSIAASPDPGVRMKFRRSFRVRDSEEMECEFTVDPEIVEKKQAPEAAMLKTEIIVDGVRVPLANGFQVLQAIDLVLEGSPRSVLRMNRGQKAVLSLRSNLDVACSVDLNVTSDPKNAVSGRRRLKLGKRGGAELEIPVKVEDPGPVSLTVQARARVGRRWTSTKPRKVDLLAVEWDGTGGTVGEDYALLYAGGRVLSVNLRSGRATVYQTMRGEREELLHIFPPSLGVPFSWEDFFQEKAVASITSRAGDHLPSGRSPPERAISSSSCAAGPSSAPV